MEIDSNIFRAYDIRGIYPSEINNEVAFAVGQGVSSLLTRETQKQLTLVVGSDMRTSSPELKERLIAGLRECGANVIDVGLVSTPTFYYAVASLGTDGGIQVSASHNPKEYNGFKIVRRGAVAMSGQSGLEDLKNIIANDDFITGAVPGELSLETGLAEAALDEYLKFVNLAQLPKLKIVVDTASGAGGLDYEVLFGKLPCDLVKMNFELDGTFPAHEADPLKPENTKDLQNRVVAESADLGVAADGDNDRIFIIDEQGQRIPSSILYTLLAKHELEKNPNLTFAYEIRLGMIIQDEFISKGVSMLPTPVGHSLEKALMLSGGADFGGELSGHYFYRLSVGTFEAPSLVLMKLLEIIAESGKPLSAIWHEYNKYFSSGEVNVPAPSREFINEHIETLKNFYSDGKPTEIDGIKIEYDDWWFSLRASNTESLMRLVVEARTQALLDQKVQELKEKIS